MTENAELRKDMLELAEELSDEDAYSEWVNMWGDAYVIRLRADNGQELAEMVVRFFRE
jgi:hypothetical protein